MNEVRVPKSILVTGAAGFLGSHLVQRLIRHEGAYDVSGLDNLMTGQVENLHGILHTGRFTFVRGDVTSPLRFDVQEIYHLACPASPIHYQRDPVQTIRTCVEGTLRVLEHARNIGARVLIASTSEVYGDPSVHPQREDYWGNVNPIGPRACYDEGKRCAEALATSYAKQYGVEVRIARIFNTYGPKMAENDGRVVSTMILQALKDEAITIFGTGEQTRSFCYVDDLIRGLIGLMASSEDEPVNLGNPNEVTVNHVALTIRSMVGGNSPIVHRPLPVDDPTRRKPDISKAKRVLSWEPKVDLRAGLQRTIDYFHDRLSSKRLGTENLCVEA